MAKYVDKKIIISSVVAAVLSFVVIEAVKAVKIIRSTQMDVTNGR